LGLVGVAIVGVYLFSDVLQLLQSPRVGGQAGYFKALSSTLMFDTAGREHNVTAIARLFSSDLLGTGIDFKGWSNYLEAPLFYCGLPSLLLVPQAFAWFDGRRRMLYGALLAPFAAGVVFPYFRYAFWAFSGDYYRTFSLLIAILLLFFGSWGLSSIEERSRARLPSLVISLAVLLLLLRFLSTDPTILVDRDLVRLASALLVAYAAALLLIRIPGARAAMMASFLVLASLEVAYWSHISVSSRSVITASELGQKVGYNDYTTDAIAYLKSTDRGFYRVDKDYSSGPAIHA